MVSISVQTVAYRFALPIAFLLGAVLRPSFISAVYLLFALILPVLPALSPYYPTAFSTKVYLTSSMIISLLAAFGQATYQIYEISTSPDVDDYTRSCQSSWSIYWLRQLGFIRVKMDAKLDAVRVVLPEILTSFTSAVAFILCVILSSCGSGPSSSVSVHPGESVSSLVHRRSATTNSTFLFSSKRFSDVIVVLSLCFLGIVEACLLNAVYFIFFLFIITWWAAYIPLRRTAFSAIKAAIATYCLFHCFIIYLYQIQYFNEIIPDGSVVARVVGLFKFLSTDCNEWWSISIVPQRTANLLKSVLLLCVYFLLVVQYKWTRSCIRGTLAGERDNGSSIHEELLVASDDQLPSTVYGTERLMTASIERQRVDSSLEGLKGLPCALPDAVVTLISIFCIYCWIFVPVAMMLWALIYHSAFGLIFLILACIFWVYRDSRTAVFRCSPVLVAYVEFLLMQQYVFSMDLQSELPKSDILELIGFVVASGRIEAFVTLAAKVSLSLPFFFLLRQYSRERFYNSLIERERPRRLVYGTFDADSTAPSSHADVIRKYASLNQWFIKYWIFFISVVLLLLAIQSPPVAYTVGYFVLFSFLILVFLLDFQLFRNVIYIYWTFVVLYTAFVFVVLYCYQFPGAPSWWRDLTGLDILWCHDLGLVNFREEGVKASISIRLFGLIFLFFITMLQLKFFHDPWSGLVDPSSTTANDALNVEQRDHRSYYARAKVVFDMTVDFLWRFLEVHVFKVVMFILVVVAVNQICALNLLVIVLISVAVCLPRLSPLLCFFMCTYSAVFATIKMIYQMHFISDNLTEQSLAIEDAACNISGAAPVTVVQWLGFHKVLNIGDDLAGLIVAMVALASQSIVIYRQRYSYTVHGKPRTRRRVIFSEAEAAAWDSSLTEMMKFLLNYGFYKFGVELSMIMMVIVAWIRMDVLGAILMLWLLLFVLVSRPTRRKVWPIFLLYLAILFPMQYAVYVGLPPSECIEYPWDHWLINPKQNDNLIFWLDLASYRITFNHYNTVADFFLLLMVACQEYAFHAESSSHPAKDNKSIYANGDYSFRNENPYYDFVAEQRSFVDFIKIAVFMYGHWATLVMVLVAGLGGVSLFALGYIILAFWMLWQGNSLYDMRTYQRTLNRWKSLLIYCVFVMFWKVVLQAVGCAFIHLLYEGNLCYVRQLFSIVCLRNDFSNYYFPEELEFDNTCTVQMSEAQIGFDVFCFAFLVFQLRILHSWYFQFCMLDFRCEAVLMNRGAILSNQLIEKEMKEQNVQQRNKVDEIKDRTAKIRKRYEEQQQSGFGSFIPETYGQAKRAGDYYMFDYDPSREEIVEYAVPRPTEVTPGATEYEHLDVAQLVDIITAKDQGQPSMATKSTAQNGEQTETRMTVDENKYGLSDKTEAVEVEHVKPEHAEQEERCIESPHSKSEEIASKAFVVLNILTKLVSITIDWFAIFLNRHSQDHRYIAYVLTKEKLRLKNSLREYLIDPSRPIAWIREEWERKNLNYVAREKDIERVETEAHENWMNRNVFVRFIAAAGSCIAAHTDLLCYLLAVIDHARCAGLISLPLPLLVFFWGTLANPRPSKVFWVVMIAYTEITVIIKFICQFGFFPWNQTSERIKAENNPYYLPGIFGVRKEEFYAFWDIVLLVCLFLHRYMLRRVGIWKDANVSDTFSETLAAHELHSLDGEGSGPSTEVACDESSTTKPSKGASPKRGPIANFFFQLFHPKFYYVKDLYPYMFFADVLCLMIVSFGYSAFGEGGSGDVVKDITANRVPLTFVLMLILISMMIIVDRALYLRKAVMCKLVYQLLIVVFIHAWIFFLLPKITLQSAWNNKTAQVLYIVKCVYLLFSAWQIRNGYPNLCLGNLVTHAYGLSNMIFFKIFMAIPFLFELRTSIDWTWTDTSMPLFDFFNMENFYATIYNLKCARQFEKDFPAPRGVAKGIVVKYLMGLPMIAVLILIIWLPLLAFSLLNRIGSVLTPESARLSIAVEGYPPLYTVEARGIELESVTPDEFKQIKELFSMRFNSTDSQSLLRARRAIAFIDDYTYQDVLKVRFRPESENFWSISNDALNALKYQLRDVNDSVNIDVRLWFERPGIGSSKQPVIHSRTHTITLKKNSRIRSDLIALLSGSTADRNLTLARALPVYVIVPNEGEIKPAYSLLQAICGLSSVYECRMSSNLVMKLEQPSNNLSDKLWTAELEMNNGTKAMTLPLDVVKYESKQATYVQMVAFVDRVFPTFLTKYVQGGIVAMYIAVVLLVGKLIRGIVTNQPLDVIISEIPNPDFLLKICLDIYLVREAKDFVLEQDLFAKLIFLFRSPATLIKWTRYKVKSE